jgi:transposase
MNHVDLMTLGRIVSDERRCFEYVLQQLPAYYCPSCQSSEYYVMSRQRVRCKQCRKDLRPLGGTNFSLLNIPCSTWLILLKLFELSISARKAAMEAGLSYKTTLKGYDIIRRAITEELAKSDDLLKGEVEADEAYFGGKRKGKRGRGARAKTIVFGILERNHRVSVSIVPDVSAESLMKETVKRVRRGSIVYTDRWKGYDSLMFCGYRHLSIDHRYKFKSGKVYINSIEGFWSFAKELLIKYHGISRQKFLYYIKEMEWRYNNKEKDLYGLLLSYMLS